MKIGKYITVNSTCI